MRVEVHDAGEWSSLTMVEHLDSTRLLAFFFGDEFWRVGGSGGERHLEVRRTSTGAGSRRTTNSGVQSWLG